MYGHTVPKGWGLKKFQVSFNSQPYTFHTQGFSGESLTQN